MFGRATITLGIGPSSSLSVAPFQTNVLNISGEHAPRTPYEPPVSSIPMSILTSKSSIQSWQLVWPMLVVTTSVGEVIA